jgi:hypothetical protein
MDWDNITQTGARATGVEEGTLLMKSNLCFLVSQAKVVNSQSPVLPFNYASVDILWENLFFVFTRGGGELKRVRCP